MSSEGPAPDLPLRGEDYLHALLLAMLVQHCEIAAVELDSDAIRANADAMDACAEAGLIDITAQAGGRRIGVVRPEGWTLLHRLRTAQDKRTGADLIAALQASPHRDTEIEPERLRPERQSPRTDEIR